MTNILVVIQLKRTVQRQTPGYSNSRNWWLGGVSIPYEAVTPAFTYMINKFDDYSLPLSFHFKKYIQLFCMHLFIKGKESTLTIKIWMYQKL
jgi:hypothetical protein